LPPPPPSSSMTAAASTTRRKHQPPTILQGHVVEQVARKAAADAADEASSSTTAAGDGGNDDCGGVSSSFSAIADPDVVLEATEKYRILETRVRIGQLGSGDRGPTRAAVLLLYALRNRQRRQHSVDPGGNSNSSIGGGGSRQQQQAAVWKRLASAAGTKPAALEQLYRQIGNYLQQPAQQQQQQRARRVATTSTSSNNSNKTDKKRGPLLGGNISNGNKNTAAAMMAADHLGNGRASRGANLNRTELLPDLSIRLAGRVSDPRGCARRAADVLREVRRDFETGTMTAGERRGYLYHLQRYWPAYQAAAFYCAAKAAEGGAGGAASGRASKNKKSAKRRKTLSGDYGVGGNDGPEDDAGGDDAAADDDDEEEEELLMSGGGGPARLELEHLGDSWSEFTLWEVKEALKHVQQFAARTAPSDTDDGDKKPKGREKADDKHGRNRENHSNADDSGDGRGRDLASLCSQNGDSAAGGDRIDNADGAPRVDPVERSFREWEGTVLSEILERSKRTLMSLETGEESADGVGGDGISEELAMKHAADAVLEKFGLLPTLALPEIREI